MSSLGCRPKRQVTSTRDAVETAIENSKSGSDSTWENPRRTAGKRPVQWDRRKKLAAQKRVTQPSSTE